MSASSLPTAAELPELPVRSRAEILARVESIVERACRRQLWFLFFDAGDCQLPALVPMDIPARPEPAGPGASTEREVAAIASLLDEITDTTDAAWLVLVYERPGAAALRPEDSAWFAFLAEVADRTEMPVRAAVAVCGRRFRCIHAGEGLGPAAELAG